MWTDIDPEDAQRASERLSWRLAHSGKDCNSCGLRKPLSAFWASTDNNSGLAANCIECEIAKREAVTGRVARYRRGAPSTHGELLHYRRGCRCDLCKAARTENSRQRRASGKTG